MIKCDICGKKIEETFLGKISGTIMKRGKKLKYACPECQKKHKDKLMEKF